MPSLEVIKKITIQGRTDGVDQAQQSLEKLSVSSDKVEQALLRQQRALELTDQSSRQMAAANDNLSRSYSAANDDVRGAGDAFRSTGTELLAHTNAIKFAAVAAYALSPAFRSFANPAITAAVGATGVALKAMGPAAAEVATSIGARLLPALSLVGRLSIPIFLVVEAFKALNAVWDRGSSLLEQYAGAERRLFSSDLTANLEKLTKFQQDSISADQVQLATDLGMRLASAKSAISDFFKVQIDVTNMALKLQGAWVGTVEAIASATRGLTALLDKLPTNFFSTMGTLAQISAGGSFFPRGSSLPSPKGDRLDLDPAAAAMKAARGNLSAGMGVANLDKDGAPIGGSFAARFSGAIKDLAGGEKKATEDAADAWTKFVDQTKKADAAMVASIQTIGLTAQAHAQLKIQLEGESVLERDGVKDTEARRAALAALAKQAGETAMALERAKISDKIKFERGAAFLAPEDVQIASQLRGLYGNDIPAALASSEAAQIRFNDALKKVNDVSGTFASGFFTDLAHGVTAVTALQNAMNRLTDTLIDMAARRLMANALGGATGGFNIGSLFGLGGGAGGAGAELGKAAIVAHTGGMLGADTFSTRIVHPAHFDGAPRFGSGGVIGSDEVPIVAHKGEGVFTPAQMAAMGGASGPGKIEITMKMDFAGYMTRDDVQQVAQAAASRGVQQAVAIANNGGPARQVRYQQLGT
jgi:hypothetical protein